MNGLQATLPVKTNSPHASVTKTSQQQRRKRRQSESPVLDSLSFSGTLSSRVAPAPGDQYELEWQPQPLEPGLTVQTREWNVRRRHVDVRREHGHQQDHQAVGGGAAKARPQQSDSARDFRRSADRYQRGVPRQIRRHNTNEWLGMQEMQRARRQEQRRKEQPSDRARRDRYSTRRSRCSSSPDSPTPPILTSISRFEGRGEASSILR